MGMLRISILKNGRLKAACFILVVQRAYAPAGTRVFRYYGIGLGKLASFLETVIQRREGCSRTMGIDIVPGDGWGRHLQSLEKLFLRTSLPMKFGRKFLNRVVAEQFER